MQGFLFVREKWFLSLNCQEYPHSSLFSTGVFRSIWSFKKVSFYGTCICLGQQFSHCLPFWHSRRLLPSLEKQSCQWCTLLKLCSNFYFGRIYLNWNIAVTLLTVHINTSLIIWKIAISVSLILALTAPSTIQFCFFPFSQFCLSVVIILNGLSIRLLVSALCSDTFFFWCTTTVHYVLVYERVLICAQLF